MSLEVRRSQGAGCVGVGRHGSALGGVGLVDERGVVVEVVVPGLEVLEAAWRSGTLAGGSVPRAGGVRGGLDEWDPCWRSVPRAGGVRAGLEVLGLAWRSEPRPVVVSTGLGIKSLQHLVFPGGLPSKY